MEVNLHRLRSINKIAPYVWFIFFMVALFLVSISKKVQQVIVSNNVKINDSLKAAVIFLSLQLIICALVVLAIEWK
jgi:predicted transporter